MNIDDWPESIPIPNGDPSQATVPNLIIGIINYYQNSGRELDFAQTIIDFPQYYNLLARGIVDNILPIDMQSYAHTYVNGFFENINQARYSSDPNAPPNLGTQSILQFISSLQENISQADPDQGSNLWTQSILQFISSLQENISQADPDQGSNLGTQLQQDSNRFYTVDFTAFLGFPIENSTTEETPLPAPILESIGTKPYDVSDKFDQCSICITEYEHNESVRVLPCKHVFHPDCIDVWFQKNCVCPLCKADLRNTN